MAMFLRSVRSVIAIKIFLLFKLNSVGTQSAGIMEEFNRHDKRSGALILIAGCWKFINRIL